MSTRIIGANELRAAVSFQDLIEPVARAFRESSAGLAQNGMLALYPAPLPELGDVFVKAGVLRGHQVFIVKVAPWFRRNVDRKQPQGGFVAVFDGHTGHTLAILHDEHYLSDIRTAAAGAVAARALAPKTIRTAAVLGAGVQAYLQPQALFGERPFERLEIWARRVEAAGQLKRRLSETLTGVDIRVCVDLERAIRRSDAVMTTTAAREPLVRGEWLHEGQHITAVGADAATKCELDAASLLRGRVFVDSRSSADDNGNLRRAAQQGMFAVQQIAGEIGGVLAGTCAGRVSGAEISIATLVGIGAQDVVAAEVAMDRLGISPSATC